MFWYVCHQANHQTQHSSDIIESFHYFGGITYTKRMYTITIKDDIYVQMATNTLLLLDSYGNDI